MKQKERKQLFKILSKEYYKNSQQLYITSAEIRNKKTDYCLDIILTDKKEEKFGKYLFMIQNLQFFYNSEIQGVYSYFQENKYVDILDTKAIVSTPLYINKVFTLKKWKNITKKDIYNCTKYFIKEILDFYWIWNIKVL